MREVTFGDFAKLMASAVLEVASERVETHRNDTQTGRWLSYPSSRHSRRGKRALNRKFDDVYEIKFVRGK